MTDPRPVSGPLRWIFFVLGWLFVALAALGVFLPVLPTTPLLIVAAACFARSSPRFYAWLLDSRTFGPVLRQWRATGTIPLRIKALAIALVVTVGGSTIAFALPSPWHRLLVGAALVTGVVWIVRIPTARPLPHASRE